MSIIEAQKRLRKIAKAIENNSLEVDDKLFISNALIRISDGVDAKEALNVKPKRGERVSKAYQERLKISEAKKVFALSWIAAATSPYEEGGLGLSNEDAIGLIGEWSAELADEKAFGFTEETLLTYWAQHPELRNLVFKLPD